MMKTYGISLVANGVEYNFHVDNTAKVRELFEGCNRVTRFDVVEQTHEGLHTEYRTMHYREVAEMLFDTVGVEG
jgi:hypothetical protein